MEQLQMLKQEIKKYRNRKSELEHDREILELFKTALAIVLEVNMGDSTKFSLNTKKSYTDLNLQILYHEIRAEGYYPYVIEIQNYCERSFV